MERLLLRDRDLLESEQSLKGVFGYYEKMPHLRRQRSVRTWLQYMAGVVIAAYVVLVLAFIAAGRRTDARALAGFVPDCVVLFSRLLRDPRVPRGSKVLVAALSRTSRSRSTSSRTSSQSPVRRTTRFWSHSSCVASFAARARTCSASSGRVRTGRFS